MKFLSYILLLTFYLVTVCPAARLTACSMKGKCEMLNPPDKKSDNCDEEGCPIKMCRSCCGICCFVCPVETADYRICVAEQKLSIPEAGQQSSLPGYISNCWQPPEA